MNKELKRLIFQFKFAEKYCEEDWGWILKKSKPLIIEIIEIYAKGKKNIDHKKQKILTKIILRNLYVFFKFVYTMDGSNPYFAMSSAVQSLTKRAIERVEFWKLKS